MLKITGAELPSFETRASPAPQDEGNQRLHLNPEEGRKALPDSPDLEEGRMICPGSPHPAEGRMICPGSPHPEEGRMIYPGSPHPAEGYMICLGSPHPEEGRKARLEGFLAFVTRLLGSCP